MIASSSLHSTSFYESIVDSSSLFLTLALIRISQSFQSQLYRLDYERNDLPKKAREINVDWSLLSKVRRYESTFEGTFEGIDLRSAGVKVVQSNRNAQPGEAVGRRVRRGKAGGRPEWERAGAGGSEVKARRGRGKCRSRSHVRRRDGAKGKESEIQKITKPNT